MTNTRKIELFDELITYIAEVACTPYDLHPTLTELGFTASEIDELTSQPNCSDNYKGTSNALRVCWHCLLAIESREGSQRSLPVYVDEEDPEESFCEWCREDGFDTLYEI